MGEKGLKAPFSNIKDAMSGIYFQTCNSVQKFLATYNIMHKMTVFPNNGLVFALFQSCYVNYVTISNSTE